MSLRFLRTLNNPPDKLSPVYAIGQHAISPLGMDTAAHWHAVCEGRTGIRLHEDPSLANAPFMAAKLEPAQWQVIQEQTRSAVSLTPFEQLAIFSIKKSIDSLDEPLDMAQTALILSTTKGNIELLGKAPDERILLSYSAKQIATYFGLSNKPIIISHACVSGVVALQYGMRLIRSGRYKNVIVVGCDRFSRFVLSGFQSFQAISDEPCRPFDSSRKGITLGEAAATVILSQDHHDQAIAELAGGATSNDANHISGPSRTGEELAMAINAAIREAGITPAQVDMISAHGTATLYNDEMESKAFDLAGLLHSPVHSFKGYIGHTLGAAGVLESAMTIESMRHQTLIPSPGFDTLGVPRPITVSNTLKPANIRYALKTASGFGGCNATAIWRYIAS